MENKIKLYTCKDGKELWEEGQSFWAWTEDGEDCFDGDVCFLVDKKYILDEKKLEISGDAELEFIEIYRITK